MILSDYLEKKLLDLLLVNTAYSPPATLYFGLFTADPGPSGVANEFTIGVGSYARAVVTNNVSNFPLCSAVASPAVKTNGSIIAFPTATTAWGTATYWAVYDAATAGNMLAHGVLSAPWAVASGSTPKIMTGAMTITASNSSSGGLTAYAQRKLLDHVFSATTYTSAAAVYSGLGTALTGDSISEWTDSGYARQSTAFTASTLGSGFCANTSTQTFTAAAAGSDTITHFGIWDAASAGNLLVTGPVGSSRSVVASDTVKLLAGSAIVVTFQ